MTTNSPKILEDLTIDVKIKLSALWLVLMFCYTYADILGFYAPGNLEELIMGEIAGIQMTQEMLLGSAVLMAVPSVMIFLSLLLQAKANRLANIFAGIVYLAVLAGTFFHRQKPSLLPVLCSSKSLAACADHLARMEVAPKGSLISERRGGVFRGNDGKHHHVHNRGDSQSYTA